MKPCMTGECVVVELVTRCDNGFCVQVDMDGPYIRLTDTKRLTGSAVRVPVGQWAEFLREAMTWSTVERVRVGNVRLRQTTPDDRPQDHQEWPICMEQLLGTHERKLFYSLGEWQKFVREAEVGDYELVLRRSIPERAPL